MKKESIPLTFERGAVDRYSPTMLQPGEGTQIQNWVPEPNGMLRMRHHWINETDTGLSVNRQGRGLHHHAFNLTTRYLVAATAASSDTSLVKAYMWGMPGTEWQIRDFYVFTNNRYYYPESGDFTITWDDGTGALTTPPISIPVGAGTSQDWVATLQSNIQAALDATWAVDDIVATVSGLAVIAAPWYSTNPAYKTTIGLFFAGSDGQSSYSSLPVPNLFTIDGTNLVGAHMTHMDDDPSYRVLTGTNQATMQVTFAGYGTTVPVNCWPAGPGYASQDPQLVADDLKAAMTLLDATLGGAAVTGTYSSGITTLSMVWDEGALPDPLPTTDNVTIAFTGGATNQPPYVVSSGANFGNYAIYTLPEGGTWSYLGQLAASAPAQTAPVTFASGAGIMAAVAAGSSFMAWDGATFQEVILLDEDGFAFMPQSLAYHKSRFFVGSDTMLWYSQLLDHTVWTDEVTGLNNNIPVGALDGEQIEALQSYEDLLIIGKRNSTWMLSGSSSATFTLRKMIGGGCAPGDTLVPTPYGLVAIGRDTVWQYNGGPWREISENIRESYGMTGDFMTGAYCAGSVYICDQGSGVTWVYNFESGAWSTEVPGDLNEGPALVYSKADYLYAQPRDASTNSLVMHRQMPVGQRRRDENVAQTMIANTGTTWFGTAEKPYTILQLSMRLRQDFGDSGSAPLIVTPMVDGQARNSVAIQPRNNPPQVWRERVSLSGTGYGASVEFRQELAADQEGGINIEELIWEIALEEPR